VHHRHDLVSQFTVRHAVLEVPEQEVEPKPEASPPRVIRTASFPVKEMTVDEAVMQMDLMNNAFYVFTNNTTQEMNVVYRRKDGEVGLIEASAAQKA